MKKFTIIMVAAFFSVLLIGLNGWAQVTKANLDRISKEKFSEEQVRSLLGEPKKTKKFTKIKRGGREIHDMLRMYYEMDGKEVHIYIDKTDGHVTRVTQD
jgi:hypothetical protein